MPLILHETLSPAGEYGLWRIEEPEAWFLERLALAPAEAAQLAGIQGRRRVEWLAVRQLVHHMSGRQVRGAFIKDEYGKPHLEGTSWHISISHSHGVAAAIAAPVPVGIDIQYLVPKIERLAPRVLSTAELASLSPAHRLEHLHVYWGAKEALYKAYGRRQIDFCADLRVGPFAYLPNGGETNARVEKDDFRAAYHVVYRRWEKEYVLVYVMVDG